MEIVFIIRNVANRVFSNTGALGKGNLVIAMILDPGKEEAERKSKLTYTVDSEKKKRFFPFPDIVRKISFNIW